MTKIVRIITRLNVGGPAIHVLWLNHLLDQRGYRSVLVSGRESPREGDMMRMAEALSVAPIRVSSLQREVSPFADLIAVWKLVRILRREKPAIVHTHTAKAGTLGRIAAWIARVPLRVHTHHGHTLYGYFPSWKTSLFVAVEKLLGRLTTHFVTVSRRVRDDLIAAGMVTSEKITVIPLGLDLAALGALETNKGRFRKRLGLSPTVPIVGIVARLVAIKGHQHFIEAARVLLRERGSSQVFVIVGDGELRRHLAEKVVSLGLGERILFVGFQENMAEVYSDLDVLALSSLNEGLPVAAIEALASGVPIVATRVGGVPDLLEGVDSALLVDPANPSALATALQEVLSNLSDYKERAEKHMASTRETYSAHRLAEDMDTLYRRLTTSH
jgi:glycosyltransferase involved in cell wall biosynthesis